MSKIDEFILKVQKSASTVKRSTANEHLKSKYADLEDVLDLLNPFFVEAGVICEQYTYFDTHMFDRERFGQWVLRTEFRAEGEVRAWQHPLFGIEQSKNPMQALGAAQTYARRYTLKGIFKLVDSDDDANIVTPSGAPSKPARKSEVDKMLRAFAGLHVSKGEVEQIVQTDIEKFTLEDMENLKKVYSAIKAGTKKKDEFLKEGDQEWQE